MKKIVVIGGGHGQSTILKGIKKIPDIDISAIVTVADDGVRPAVCAAIIRSLRWEISATFSPRYAMSSRFLSH